MSAAFGILGFCMLGILPISMECAAECTYPIPENSSTGLLMVHFLSYISLKLWAL